MIYGYKDYIKIVIKTVIMSRNGFYTFLKFHFKNHENFYIFFINNQK